MKNSKKKLLLKWLFMLFAFFYLNTIESQANETYQIVRKLNLKDAISLKKADSYGIATQTNSGSNARAIIAMSTLDNVEFEYLNGGLSNYYSGQIDLYRTFVGGSNANISHTGHEAQFFYKPFFSLLNFYAGITYNSAGGITDSIEYIKYMLRLAYAEIAEKDQSTLNWFFFNANPTIDVQIQLTLENGMKLSDILKIELPGIPTLYSHDFRQKEVDNLRDILENPNKYPNYVMLAAHRGYWKYSPQNSLEAYKNAIDFGADIVEIDIAMTADNKIMIAYDSHLGRLTNIPEKLKNPIFQENGAGYYLFSKMKFCDLRPDLCPGNPDYNVANSNNCNTCTGTPGINNTIPVNLIRPNGNEAEKLVTLAEAFDFFLNNPAILIDIDKIGIGLGTPEEPKTFFFDELYKLAKEKKILNRIIVKGKVESLSPKDLKASKVVDWSQWYYTPTAFQHIKTDKCMEGNPDISLKDCLDLYLSDDKINAPGVEYVYLEEDNPEFTEVYNHIRNTRNDRVFQFPSYPENDAGVWTPRYFIFNDIDSTIDRRNDWNWLLQDVRRPDVIISDRFEVLYNLLEDLGLRQK